MTWLLKSTAGRAVTFYVDVICGLLGKAFVYLDGDEDD